jgi:hypothetical protein
VDWPRGLYDPAGAGFGRGADLILPMPCGGAMAFQRVDVPVDPRDPLDDLQVRFGQSGTEAGYAEYLRLAHLRGAFPSASRAGSSYFIGRYEVTQGQMSAVTDPACREVDQTDRFAAGGVSWFAAVDFARAYTIWLREHAPEALPEAGDGSAFLRLPTEDEWEYAARGGASVTEGEFAGALFPMTGPLEDYAVHKTPGSSSGRLRPVGLLKPNPLGLYDILGNAEELMLEPYRLNAVGRLHGGAGGLVTRGGWYGSDPLDISSAARTEYPPYSLTEATPQALPSFGFRLVISATAAQSDETVRDLRDAFAERVTAPREGQEDPAKILADLAAVEFDPAKRAAIDAAQVAIAEARDKSAAADKEGLGVALLSGAVLLTTIRDDTAAIPAAEELVAALQDYVDHERDPDEVASYTAKLARATTGLNERVDRRWNSLRAYRQILDALSKSHSEERFRLSVDQLFARFDTEHQLRLQQALYLLLANLSVFLENPDISDERLLAITEG